MPSWPFWITVTQLLMPIFSHLRLLCRLRDSPPGAWHSNARFGAGAFLFLQDVATEGFSNNQDSYLWWLKVPHTWTHVCAGSAMPCGKNSFLGTVLVYDYSSSNFQPPATGQSITAITAFIARAYDLDLFLAPFNITEKLQRLLKNAGVLSAFPICLNSIFPSNPKALENKQLPP